MLETSRSQRETFRRGISQMVKYKIEAEIVSYLDHKNFMEWLKVKGFEDILCKEVKE